MLGRWLVISAILAALCGGAHASEPAPDLRALIDGFQTHRRVAIGYLRSGNAELGAVTVARLQERWAADRRRLSPKTVSDHLLTKALAHTELLIAEAQKAADAGDTERAYTRLEEASASLAAWRRANDIHLFSDCIAEIGEAFGKLDGYRRNVPDLSDASTSQAIVSFSTATISAIERCDREASDATRRDPEFRRLIDGMLASLRQIPAAVKARDRAYLHRLLIEQRSFERLLSFRFG